MTPGNPDEENGQRCWQFDCARHWWHV